MKRNQEIIKQLNHTLLISILLRSFPVHSTQSDNKLTAGINHHSLFWYFLIECKLIIFKPTVDSGFIRSFKSTHVNNLFLVYVVLWSHVLGSALVNDWLKEFLEFIEYSRSLFFKCLVSLGFPGGSDGKESASMFGRPGFNPWVGKNP